MTEPSAPTSPDLAAATAPDEPGTPSRPVSRDAAFVEHLTRLCTVNPGARGALRRGDAAALADRALPYLAAWNWGPAELEAALLFAALRARYPDVHTDPGSPLGRAAFRTLTGAERYQPDETGPGRRVIGVQRQSLKVAHRTITALVAGVAAEPGLGLDWAGLWRTYRTWEARQPERRRQARQRLLLDFYGATTTPSDERRAS